MSISNMVAAARDGKLTAFDAAFQQAIASKIVDAVDSVKADIGASVRIDGEESVGGDEDGSGN